MSRRNNQDSDSGDEGGFELDYTGSSINPSIHRAFHRVFRQQSSPPENIRRLNAFLDQYESTLGPVHSNVLDVTMQLTRDYISIQEYASAERLLRQRIYALREELRNSTLPIYPKSRFFCDSHSEKERHQSCEHRLSACLHQLGHVLNLEEKYLEALEVLEQYRSIYIPQGDAPQIDYTSMLPWNASATQAQGKYDEAAKYWTQALEVNVNEYGYMECSMEILQQLAQCHELQGKWSDAEKRWLQYIQIRRCMQGNNHSLTIEGIKSLIQLYERTEQVAKAEEWKLTLREYSR